MSFAPPNLPDLLKLAFIGSLMAGLYGIIQAEITCSISQEYLLHQFSSELVGMSQHCALALRGFVAASWKGFIAACILARVGVQLLPDQEAQKKVIRGMAVVLACALLGGVTGYFAGLLHDANYLSWGPTYDPGIYNYFIIDIRDFVRVAWIHQGSTMGGLLGLLLALKALKKRGAALPKIAAA